MPLYTNIEDFKKYTSVRDASNMPQLCLDSAEQIVERYLGYNPTISDYNHRIDGTGLDWISLRAKPVREVRLLEGSNITIPTGLLQYTKDEFLYLKEGIFPRGKRNIIISYSAGWDLPVNDDNVESPDDIDVDGGTGDTEYNEEFDGGDSAAVFGDEFNGGSANGTNELLETTILPDIFPLTVYRVAALLISEADGNIGLTGKSFGDSGGRTFISYANFDKYLAPLSYFKLLVV